MFILFLIKKKKICFSFHFFSFLIALSPQTPSSLFFFLPPPLPIYYSPTRYPVASHLIDPSRQPTDPSPQTHLFSLFAHIGIWVIGFFCVCLIDFCSDRNSVAVVFLVVAVFFFFFFFLLWALVEVVVGVVVEVVVAS